MDEAQVNEHQAVAEGEESHSSTSPTAQSNQDYKQYNNGYQQSPFGPRGRGYGGWNARYKTNKQW